MKNRLLRLLIILPLVMGIAGCSVMSSGKKRAPKKKVFWELPNEELTVPAPPRPGLAPKKAPEKVVVKTPAAPAAPVAPVAPAEVMVKAPLTETPAKKKRGWWPFGKAAAKSSAQENVPVVRSGDRPIPNPPRPATRPVDEGAERSRPTKPSAGSGNAGRSVVAYRMQEGDALIVKIVGPESHVVEDQIDENGKISLPYISLPIRIAGMTGSEIESFVQDLYITKEKIFKRCSVTVIVPGRFYTMDGEVVRKGRYPVVPGMTLVRAIATAGGTTEWAQAKKIKLIRGGRTRVFNFFQLRDDNDLDVIIEPGDIISIPRSW